jgi:pimeloyl-ACP methyl ester carboxylesterase
MNYPLISPTLSEMRVDFVEAGAGQLVLLVHSSLSGARQWSSLMRDLQTRMRVRAVNLFGYGSTPAWDQWRAPTLDDYADLLARAVPEGVAKISLVGHSFGGAVAMQAAARQLKGRVERLVLIEPSPFYLLHRSGHHDEFRELSVLANLSKQCIGDRKPEVAAVLFIDYWGGPGTWSAGSVERRSGFVRLIPVIANEWNAVLDGDMELDDWAAELPSDTLVVSAAGIRRPLAVLAKLLLDARPDWQFASIGEGGHMAPVTHPHLVNPIVEAFLARRDNHLDRGPAPFHSPLTGEGDGH